MSKAVLMSIKPQWCELIVSGKKTVELRKTKPELRTPFKVYIYCTQGEALALPCLNNPRYTIQRMNNGTPNGRKMTAEEREQSDHQFANGKVIGEFICDRIRYEAEVADGLVDIVLSETSCVDYKEIIEYANGNPLYSWHISDLVIYDKSKELSEFLGLRKTKFGYEPAEIKRPPQSWMYVKEA